MQYNNDNDNIPWLQSPQRFNNDNDNIPWLQSPQRFNNDNDNIPWLKSPQRFLCLLVPEHCGGYLGTGKNELLG